jgi:hypothetical protein
MEAHVLEQHEPAVRKIARRRDTGLTDAVVDELHGNAEQLGQPSRERAQRILRIRLPVGPAEVRENHGLRAVFV